VRCCVPSTPGRVPPAEDTAIAQVTDRRDAPLDDETMRLLVRRVRAGLWILLLAILLFGLIELTFDREHLVPLATLKAVQLATVLFVFWLLASPARWRWCVWAALGTAAEVCITTALSGVVTHDVATTYLLFILFTTAAAAFLPWGVGPQLGMVAVASLAVAGNAFAVREPVAAAAYPAVAMVLAFVTSVYIAWDSRRYALERRRAEEILAIAKRQSESEAQVFAALARVGQELIALLDTPRILDHLCRVTTEVLGCDRSHTWLWQPEAHAYLPVAGHGELPGYGNELEQVSIPRAQIAGLLAELERDGLVQQRGSSGLPFEGSPVTLHVALHRGGEIIGIHTAGYRAEPAGFALQQHRILRGIGQLASLALANARLVEELAQASRVKSDFVSTMSHELRTPLHVILGYADMIEETTGPADPRRELVQRIRRSGRDLLELIESTLDIGRLEAGGDGPHFEPVSLRRFWERLRGECAELPRRDGITLDWPVDVPDTSLVTDPRKLGIVMRNLVSNALKFTEQGSVQAEARLDGERIILRVADTGIGIDEPDRAVIFDMFRQADSSDSRRFGGSGLGLYIARRFVEQLGGTITLESAPQHGSVFTVTLPRARGHRSGGGGLARHGQAAGHAQHLAGHVGRLVGGQVGDRARDVLGLGQAAERDGALHPGQDLRAALARHDVAQELRVHRSGADHVHGDAVTRDLARERLGEADERRLAARVHGLAGAADAPGVGRDGDDPPAPPRDHAPQHGARGVEGAFEVDRDEPLPEGRIALDEGHQALPAGVVDEHVDRAELVLGGAHGRLERDQVADVRVGAQRPPARDHDLVRDRAGVPAVQVGDPDRRARLGQAERDGAPDATATSGDERDRAAQLRVGSAALKVPLTATSPFWLSASTSPSMRFSPSSSYFLVTLPLQVMESPGHTRVAKRTLKRRRLSTPT
jgi:signal transduction histidine kinase